MVDSVMKSNAMKNMPKILDKDQAKEYSERVMKGGLDDVPVGYSVAVSRQSGRKTVKVSDLYGNCFVFREKV